MKRSIYKAPFYNTYISENKNDFLSHLIYNIFMFLTSLFDTIFFSHVQ